MLFSIIIPTYNEARFIEKCLNSILQQDIERSEYEIIVSDASSTDNTCVLAKQLSDLIVVTEERGISIGRNRGAEKARGEVLIFVDADTTLAKNFLTIMSSAFHDPKVVGITGIGDAEDGKLIHHLVYKSTYYLVRIFNSIGLSLFPGICVAYRRKEFEFVGGFREDFGIVEDLDMSRRISRLGKCIINNKARARVSTRRLHKYLISITLFHMYCDIRYLMFGKAPAVYPKSEEMLSWLDIWRQLKANEEEKKELK